mmetsp:Transcript_45342/g.131276  ORF Transcript_45342/g.131276 Transcript_45342/m.131276 type:complete len:221 (-) Transcript_45342:296-958(-)
MRVRGQQTSLRVRPFERAVDQAYRSGRAGNQLPGPLAEHERPIAPRHRAGCRRCYAKQRLPEPAGFEQGREQAGGRSQQRQVPPHAGWIRGGGAHHQRRGPAHRVGQRRHASRAAWHVGRGFEQGISVTLAPRHKAAARGVGHRHSGAHPRQHSLTPCGLHHVERLRGADRAPDLATHRRDHVVQALRLRRHTRGAMRVPRPRDRADAGIRGALATPRDA